LRAVCLESKYKTVCTVSLVFCTVVQAANYINSTVVSVNVLFNVA